MSTAAENLKFHSITVPCRRISPTLKFGHSEEMALLLHDGADFRTMIDIGNYAHSKAVTRGSTAVVAVLLANGSKIEEMSSYGMKPVYIPISEGSKEIAKLSLDNGANLQSVVIEPHPEYPRLEFGYIALMAGKYMISNWNC
jgi:ankyrin repeat protein